MAGLRAARVHFSDPLATRALPPYQRLASWAHERWRRLRRRPAEVHASVTVHTSGALGLGTVPGHKQFRVLPKTIKTREALDELAATVAAFIEYEANMGGVSRA